MFKAFKTLFGKKDAADPVAEALFKQICFALWPQFKMLGLEERAVPATGTYASERSRGYLLGLAEAVLLNNVPQGASQERVMLVLAIAFVEAYGEAAHHLIVAQTLDEFQANNPAVVLGAQRAHDDMNAIYAGEANAVAMGFWQFNNGLSQAE